MSLVSPTLSCLFASGSDVGCPLGVPTTLIPVEDVAVILLVHNSMRNTMLILPSPNGFGMIDVCRCSFLSNASDTHSIASMSSVPSLIGAENTFHASSNSGREQSRKGLGMFMLMIVRLWG